LEQEFPLLLRKLGYEIKTFDEKIDIKEKTSLNNRLKEIEKEIDNKKDEKIKEIFDKYEVLDEEEYSYLKSHPENIDEVDRIRMQKTKMLRKFNISKLKEEKIELNSDLFVKYIKGSKIRKFYNYAKERSDLKDLLEKEIRKGIKIEDLNVDLQRYYLIKEIMNISGLNSSLEGIIPHEKLDEIIEFLNKNKRIYEVSFHNQTERKKVEFKRSNIKTILSGIFYKWSGSEIEVERKKVRIDGKLKWITDYKLSISNEFKILHENFIMKK
jgi:hypothetical protein